MRELEAAEGYLQLEMAEDALVELRNTPSSKQHSERYKELLLATHMMLEQWNPASAIAQELCIIDHKEKSYFIHAAFCLHEIGDTKAALEQLLKGPVTLIKDPLYHYNLACYHAVLGELTQAKTSYEQSIKLDPELKKTALEDKDLQSLFK